MPTTRYFLKNIVMQDLQEKVHYESIQTKKERKNNNSGFCLNLHQSHFCRFADLGEKVMLKIF
jgi:hypothetical protein